jgi:Cysteine-rich CWC
MSLPAPPPGNTPIETASATQCPLCGQANFCAMEVEKLTGVAQPPCWCNGVKFEATLIEKIPAAARGLACVCAACASNTLNNIAIK